ncbi:hypothetical protein F5Y16DRAFT_393148, partial [Xylariaceae sp. FL0255]
MELLDPVTVEALQLKAPGAYDSERNRLNLQVLSGEILGAYPGAHRQTLWARICTASTECLIPSLFSFFEDAKCLRAAANCMKMLIKLRDGQTIRSAFEQLYKEPKAS